MNEGEKKEAEVAPPPPEEEDGINKQQTTILEQVRLLKPEGHTCYDLA